MESVRWGLLDIDGSIVLSCSTHPEAEHHWREMGGECSGFKLIRFTIHDSSEDVPVRAAGAEPAPKKQPFPVFVVRDMDGEACPVQAIFTDQAEADAFAARHETEFTNLLVDTWLVNRTHPEPDQRIYWVMCAEGSGDLHVREVLYNPALAADDPEGWDSGARTSWRTSDGSLQIVSRVLARSESEARDIMVKRLADLLATRPKHVKNQP